MPGAACLLELPNRGENVIIIMLCFLEAVSTDPMFLLGEGKGFVLLSSSSVQVACAPPASWCQLLAFYELSRESVQVLACTGSNPCHIPAPPPQSLALCSLPCSPPPLPCYVGAHRFCVDCGMTRKERW